MKKYCVLLAVVCVMSGTLMAGLTVFDKDGGGLVGWTEVSGAVPGSLSDINFGAAMGLSGNTGFATAEPLEDLMTLKTPQGARVARIQATALDRVFVHQGSYVGVRYEAPAGETITSVSIPKVIFNVDTDMLVHIVDADGVLLAESVRSAEVFEFISMSATGFDTSAIELRYTGTHTNVWENVSWSGNYVAFETVEVTTIPEPATMSLLALGSLAFLKSFLL